jgi:bifunctional DNA-binding transcriptional regulator/antitoxin component of YhaV-PrlF toxin-antitoxin module
VIIREKYRLEEGDPITLIDLGEGVFLSPKRSLLPKLAEEIERLRKKHGVSIEELVAGIAEQRAKYGTGVE